MTNVKTSCSKCVFAKLDANNLQTGCQLGRIDKFKALGVPVSLESGKDGRLTYLIKRVCMAARQVEWADGKPTEKLPGLVREELADLFRAQVYLVIDKNTLFDDVFTTVESLAKQTFLPANIRLIITDNVKIEPYISRLFKRYNDKFARWNVQQIAQTERDEKGNYPEYGRCIDLAVPHCESFLYATFVPGYTVPTKFFELIDKAINDDLKTFLALEGKGNNGNVFLTYMHKRLNGNERCEMVEESYEEMAQPTPVVISGLLNKIRFLEKATVANNLILPVSEICQI